MTREGDHFEGEPERGKIKSVFDIEIRCESLGAAKSKKDRRNRLHQGVALSSVPEHVSSLHHSQVIPVHGYYALEPFSEMPGIAGMVEISMSENDQVEIAARAASLLQLAVELSPVD